MTNYIINNNVVKILGDDEINIQSKLPLGTYLVKQNNMTEELYLEKTSNFDKPKKIYGDCEKQSEKIINTFKDRVNNTGVLLSGAKGSGKTFLAKYISYNLLKENYPTIIVNEVFDSTKLSLLIQTIYEPCVIIFDEFEKIYNTRNKDDDIDNPQNGLLSLLDGLFRTKKLFIFTCNNEYYISDLLKNRPGRIYYKLEFKGISEQAIQEYCEENLQNKEYISQIFNISKMLKDFTFDILQCIVEEVNRYGEAPLEAVKMLNVTPESNYSRYSISVKPLLGQKIINYQKTISTNPFSNNEESIWIERKGGNPIDADDRWEISEVEVDDEEDTFDSVKDYAKISLDTLVSTNQKTFEYKSIGYHITLTKKEYDASDLWQYAY